MKLKLEAGEYRHFLFLKIPRNPRLLYALGARVPAQQIYDAGSRTLRITVDAAEAGMLRIGVYTTAPLRAVTGTRTGKIPFTWEQSASLLTFEVLHVPGQTFEIRFD